MNQLIIWDCIAKIFVFALVLLIFGTKFSILGGGKVGLVLCALRAFLGTTLFGFNRLVPVGIVLFRYIMVCGKSMYCSEVHGGAGPGFRPASAHYIAEQV